MSLVIDSKNKNINDRTSWILQQKELLELERLAEVESSTSQVIINCIAF